MRPSASEQKVISKPPQPGAPRNISYPVIPEEMLPNGLRVLVIVDHRLPRISVRFAAPAGRVDDPADNWSLLTLSVEMLQEGTEKHSSRQLADALDQLAIRTNSETLMEYSLLSATVLEEHLETALDLFSEMLQKPTFPEEELLKLKVRWRSHLIAQRSQPAFLGQERTFHTLFPQHPYSRVSPPVGHLESAQRDSIRENYFRRFVPNGSYLLFAGPVSLEQAVELAFRYFGSWEGDQERRRPYPDVEPLERRLVRLVHRPHSVQSHIVVSARAPARRDPALHRFRLTNQVFGGSASSRLFLNLRERKGYTYAAYSTLRLYREGGLFLATTDVNPEVTTDAIGEILAELDETRKTPPLKEELQRCQAELVGSFIRQMETPSAVGSMELIRRLNHLPEDYFARFIPNMRSVTAEQVLETSRRYFDPAQVLITVVADREDVENDLRRLGELEIYDSEGNVQS